MEEVPESFKEALRKSFELACSRGGWIYFGGKIIISTEKPKPGQRQVIKGTTILEKKIEI